MYRTKISSSGILTGDFFAIVFGLGTICGVALLNWSDYSPLFICLTLVLICVTCWFYRRYKTIRFDDSKIYFRKEGKDLEIPLSNIITLNAEWFPADEYEYGYRITYTTLDGQSDSVKFIPNKNSREYDRFIQILKSRNGNVKIPL